MIILRKMQHNECMKLSFFLADTFLLFKSGSMCNFNNTLSVHE